MTRIVRGRGLIASSSTHIEPLLVIVWEVECYSRMLSAYSPSWDPIWRVWSWSSNATSLPRSGILTPSTLEEEYGIGNYLGTPPYPPINCWWQCREGVLNLDTWSCDWGDNCNLWDTGIAAFSFNLNVSRPIGWAKGVWPTKYKL